MQVGGVTSGAVSNARTSDPLVAPARPEAANDSVKAATVAISSHVYVPAKPVQQAESGSLQATSSSRMSAVDDAHRTAWSALNNERFRLAMEKLADVRTSDAVMMMRPIDGAGTDLRSALARYEENS